MTSGRIFNVMRFSTHDGPGIRTTVFLKGCPLGCWWCHNPEGQAAEPEVVYRDDRCTGCGDCFAACPHGAIEPAGGLFPTIREKCRLHTDCSGDCAGACPSGAREIAGRELTARQLVDEIARDLVFYDESGGGVTFSGGEPLAQPGFLAEALERCKEEGIRTAVNTSGFADTRTLLSLGDKVDLFLYDVKLMDEERHRRFTGASNGLPLRNLRELAQNHGNVVVRLPIVPGANDDDENLAMTRGFLGALPRVAGVHVLPYHRAGAEKYRRLGRRCRLPDTAPPPAERVAAIAGSLERLGFKVKIGG